MKEGPYDLEYKKYNGKFLFKCTITKTEYHYKNKDFKHARKEIDKKNKFFNSGVTDDYEVNYINCKTLGFCEQGISDFVSILELCSPDQIEQFSISLGELKLKAASKQKEMFELYANYRGEMSSLFKGIEFSENIMRELRNSSSVEVRIEIAKRKFELEFLMCDDNWEVRAEVARGGYGLETLVNDPDFMVRLEVAKQGFNLKKLKEDSHWAVRAETAKHGYKDELIKDKDHRVRSAAKTKIK